MAEQTIFSEITLMLEIVSDDPGSTIADAVGRDSVEFLRRDGYIIEMPYSGKKGGFLVAITMLISTAANYVWSNKEIIIADLSGLVTILTSALLPLMKRLQQAYEKRVGKEVAVQFPIKFTLEMRGVQIQIEVVDLENAEKVLQLAQRIRADPLHNIDGKQSQPRLKASIAAKPRRKKG